MKLEIIAKVRDIQIVAGGGGYNFKTKLFSHSSTLTDDNSNIFVKLTRSSWWRMDFNVVVADEKYKLRQRPLETEIISERSKTRFYTLSGLDFFKENSLVTRVTSNRTSTRKFTVEINEENHWLVLLAATCLECNIVVASG